MDLIIVGAGGLGREVLQWALDAIAAGRLDARVRGFLDDTGPDLARFALGVPVLGPVDPALLKPGDACVVAVGDPVARATLADRLAAGGAAFAAVVHPTALVAPSARIAPGAVVCPFGFVGPEATVGAHALVNVRGTVAHDAVVGRAAVLAPHAVLNGAAVLADGAMLGTGAAVMPRMRVGAGARVAPGAMVHADVPAGAFALGNPARWRAGEGG
jgi:sugar O-acyltransferase (sialic acid O-acetyltransferase NeuD family)